MLESTSKLEPNEGAFGARVYQGSDVSPLVATVADLDDSVWKYPC